MMAVFTVDRILMVLIVAVVVSIVMLERLFLFDSEMMVHLFPVVGVRSLHGCDDISCLLDPRKNERTNEPKRTKEHSFTSQKL